MTCKHKAGWEEAGTCRHMSELVAEETCIHK